MGNSSNRDDSDTPVSNKSTPILLISTVTDTTWRMFVPSVGFTLLGVWLDSIYGTKPWLMAIGVVLGFGFAVVLVRRQIDRLKKEQR